MVDSDAEREYPHASVTVYSSSLRGSSGEDAQVRSSWKARRISSEKQVESEKVVELKSTMHFVHQMEADVRSNSHCK